MSTPVETPSAPPAKASVIQDGRVDLSSVFQKGAGARGDRPAPFFEPEPTAASLEADPAWKAFQRVHTESLVPESPLDFNLEPMKQAEAAMAASGGRATLPADIAALLGPARSPAAPAPQAQPAAGQTAAEPKPGTPEDIERRTRAVTALKRDEWTDKEIEVLSNEQLLERGSRAEKRQAAIDAKLDERRQAHREAKTATETKPGETGATPAPSGGPGQTAPPTLDQAVKEAAQDFSAHFTEQFGEEVGKPVGAAFEAALSKFAKAIGGGRETQGLVQGFQMLADVAESMVERDIMRTWKDEYPGALEKDTKAAIEKAYESLSATGKYQGLDGIYEAWEHARRIVMPGAQPVSAARRSAQEESDNALKAAARPLAGTRSPITGIASADQEEFQKFLQAHSLSNSIAASMGVQ